MSLRRVAMAMVAAVALVSEVPLTDAAPAETGGSEARPAVQARIVNPYAQVAWDKVEFLHSFSHQHSRDPQVFWDMGFRHFPISNYYPSRPVYPLPERFTQKHPEALGAPNAEQHSTIDSGVHFCALGSFYTVGYGLSPRIETDRSPIEHVFSNLHVFDAEQSPWLGVYRLDVRIAAQPGTDREPAVSLTIEGATRVSHKTFAPVGGGAVRGERIGVRSPVSRYLRTDTDKMRVRLDFDPATTRITQFRLMQGTNRPWQDAFRAALDGTRKDGVGRPVEGLLFPDGGGITINHPGCSVPQLLAMLDFDPRVLGIEVWNQHRRFGGPEMRFYRLWDEALRAGRPCFGFFVKDHVHRGAGRNVLLVSFSPEQTQPEREREALRAYREGRFFGLLGAVAAGENGQAVTPYDNTSFRFTRIAVKEDHTGQPAGLEVSVDGAERSKRPNTQIRFITDAGVARIVDGDQATFEFPRDSSGAIRCRYVRVEAFAYPSTHLGGQPLTAKALASMTVHEISLLHDRKGDIMPGVMDPPGQTPIPLVDMLFSQPIRMTNSL